MGKTNVILKQNIDNLGEAGDLVSVSAGYARNFLLPNHLCVLAGKAEIAALEMHKEKIRKAAQKEKERLQNLAQTLSELVLPVPVKVGQNGKIFGSVTSMHIADILSSHNVSLDKKQIHIESPLRELGEHVLSVSLGHGIHCSLKIQIVPETAQ
ncbi:MAG: 50S ribosomal protein L9 [Leptospirillia bacterium]